MPNHSPLPWRVEDQRYIVSDGAGGSFDRFTLASTRTRDGHDAAANAELIVSAVNSHAELLAALNDARQTLKACISACAQKRAMRLPSSPCLVCRLEAAIAKADAKRPNTRTDDDVEDDLRGLREGAGQ